LAGANGSGKSSLFAALKPPGVFINADVIARRLAPSYPEQASFAAGKVVLRELTAAIEARQDFVYETTLSSPSVPMREIVWCEILDIRRLQVWWTADHRLANSGANGRRESKLKVIEGGCLCGASRYVAQGEPINVRVCHCRICQRALGAAFNARVLMPLNAVTMTGALGRRNSSPVLVRGFCTVCGTSLFTERASAGVIGLTCGSLDKPEDFQPTEHIWISSKQAWLTLNDGLPQYSEGAPT
jgi:hypothetical protein